MIWYLHFLKPRWHWNPWDSTNIHHECLHRPQKPAMTWRSMRRKLTMLWPRPRPRPRLQPKPKEKLVPSPKPKPNLRLKLLPSLGPKLRLRQKATISRWNHLLVRLPALGTMGHHLPLMAHLAASGAGETSKDAANVCSQAMLAWDSFPGRIGPNGTRPTRPTNNWPYAVPYLSTEAICTRGCKEICQGVVQIALVVEIKDHLVASWKGQKECRHFAMPGATIMVYKAHWH